MGPFPYYTHSGSLKKAKGTKKNSFSKKGFFEDEGYLKNLLPGYWEDRNLQQVLKRLSSLGLLSWKPQPILNRPPPIRPPLQREVNGVLSQERERTLCEKPFLWGNYIGILVGRTNPNFWNFLGEIPSKDWGQESETAYKNGSEGGKALLV